jgi:mannose-1-phosphate guanylyltransferase
MLEAALLAAGEGRRLKPITNHYPKPLLPIVTVPLLEHILFSLKAQGIRKVCINACHLKERTAAFLEQRDFGLEIVLSEEEQILGTGGGIGRMRSHIEAEDFVVHNGDIVTDIRFKEAAVFHRANRALATLVVEKRRGSRDVLLDRSGRIKDIAGRLGGKGTPFGFTGIAILNSEIFGLLPECAFADMVDIYASLIERGKSIYGFETRGHYWLDIGTKQKYLLVHRNILIDRMKPLKRLPDVDSAVFIGEDSRVSAEVSLSGFVSIGNHCSVEAGIRLENCVLFDDTHLVDASTYTDSVLSPEFIA